MIPSSDPLARLVADEAAIDRELLATLLQDRIRLDLTHGSFSFLVGVRERLNNRQHVLTILLGQKAVHLLKGEFADGLRPQELETVTGIKGGTLRPLLKVLVDRRLIRQNQEKAYVVPGYALEEAAKFLNENGD